MAPTNTMGRVVALPEDSEEIEKKSEEEEKPGKAKIVVQAGNVVWDGE